MRAVSFSFSCAGLALLSQLVFVPPAAAKIVFEEVPYRDGEVNLKGYLAYDDSKEQQRPGVLVLPEWWGLNDYVRRRAREIAGLGFIAFAVDVYGEGKTTIDPKEAQAWAAPFRENRELYRRRLRRALDVLLKHSLIDKDRLAAIGYCFGGMGALELARAGAPLRGVVSFHGALNSSNPKDAANIKGEVLVLNGEADQMVSSEERTAFRKEMDDAHVAYTFIDFSGAVHAFTNPEVDKFGIPGIAYNKRADEASWEYMKLFFGELFRK